MIRQGGSYIVEKDGTRRQVAPPTLDHPEGNAPRDAEGKRLDRPVIASGAPSAEPKRPARTKAPAEPAAAGKE